MKKFSYLLLMLGLTFGLVTFTACGDDDDDDNNGSQNQGSSVITTNDLIGIWTVNSTDDSYVVEFTKDKVMMKENGKVEYEGNYTYKDGVVSFSYENETIQSVAGMLYNKSVLVFKSIMQTDMGNDEMLAFILFKQGKTVSATTNDIQGFWCWYEKFDGEEEIIRAALKIEGNNFDLIITPWGQRYVGTYTYRNGIIQLNVTNGYTSREEGTGNGVGWEGLNPYTLECDNWSALDKNSWTVDAVSNTPFIANGNEAYGFVANIPCIFQKKK